MIVMEAGRTMSSPRWLWVAAIWGGVALFDATQTVFGMRAEGMHHAWGLLFATTIASWLPWALATPWAVRLTRRHPPVQLRPVQTWGLHALTCASVGIISAGWTSFLNAA